MNVRKIEAAIKLFERAAVSGVKLINELTGDSLKDSPFEKQPLELQAQVLHRLKSLKTMAESQAKYEGMTPEEVDAKQAQERETERQRLRTDRNERLAKRYAKPDPVEESAEDEPAE